MREYINNVSNTTKVKTYVNSEIDKVSKALTKIASKVTNKIVRIKLGEVTNQLKLVKSQKTLKDVHLVSVLRSFDLIKEVKNVIK